jgi:nicotinamidase-related amidase
MAKPAETPTTPARDQPGYEAALLIIDLINPFDFEGGQEARAHAEKVALVVERLRQDADRKDIPTIYVNDNFGQWHSEKSKLVEHARPSLADGRIDPRDEDFFVLKPQFSGFYSTNLGVLLPKLGVRRLVLTGIATELCVAMTAADAHMRDYSLWVPSDAVVALDVAHGASALAVLRDRMGAETRATTDLSLQHWLRSGATADQRN